MRSKEMETTRAEEVKKYEKKDTKIPSLIKMFLIIHTLNILKTLCESGVVAGRELLSHFNVFVFLMFKEEEIKMPIK